MESFILNESEYIKRLEQSVYGLLLKQSGYQLEADYLPTNSPAARLLTTKMILDELLRQENPALNDADQYLKVESTYLQIERWQPFFPGLAGIGAVLARTWVLLALRKCGNPLGAETQDDKQFLELTMGLSDRQKEQEVLFHPACQMAQPEQYPVGPSSFCTRTSRRVRKWISKRLSRKSTQRNA